MTSKQITIAEILGAETRDMSPQELSAFRVELVARIPEMIEAAAMAARRGDGGALTEPPGGRGMLKVFELGSPRDRKSVV